MSPAEREALVAEIEQLFQDLYDEGEQRRQERTHAGERGAHDKRTVGAIIVFSDPRGQRTGHGFGPPIQ